MISWYMDSSCITLSKTPCHRPLFHRSHSEELLGVTDPVDQGIYLGMRVVEVERGTGACLDTKRTVQRPGAMVPRPYRDAAVVEYLAEVVRVDAVQRERDRGSPVLGRCRPENAQSVDLGQRGQGMAEQLVLVFPDTVQPHLGEVVDCRTQPDRLGDRHRACLELVRRRGERR